jgi:putative ABC transport system permease protein
MKILENIPIAFIAIKGQLLRTVLTALIIAIGIMALVGILTAIDAVENSISSNFSSMGSNSFTIRNRGLGIRIGNDGIKPKRHSKITYAEAVKFQQRLTYPSTVSISTFGTHTEVVKYKKQESNPNILVIGTDLRYLKVSGYKLKEGRNFSEQEVLSAAPVAIIGSEIVETLIGDSDSLLNELVTIGSNKYRVVGILDEKGSSMGFASDRICILPLSNVKMRYGNQNRTYTVTVMVSDIAAMESASGEATGLFRVVRGDRPGTENSFEIVKSDSLANILISQLSYVTIAATIISIITLLGAAIGLMNIMLVSVTERTREIGIRKSAGATKTAIRNQFLTEAIIICQIGGVAGVIFGILIGNLMGMSMSADFIVPWKWILSGLVVCLIVGIVSGIYPAIKAARLDPIESLRYE